MWGGDLSGFTNLLALATFSMNFLFRNSKRVSPFLDLYKIQAASSPDFSISLRVLLADINVTTKCDNVGLFANA